MQPFGYGWVSVCVWEASFGWEAEPCRETRGNGERRQVARAFSERTSFQVRFCGGRLPSWEQALWC